LANPKYTSLSGLDLSNTLAQQLIPVADLLRDLRTQFGMRPYEVHIIRTKWSGGDRGIGEEYQVMDMTILPTPRIVDLNALADVLQANGLDETGSVALDEVSGRYTDDQLRGYHDDGSPPDPDENVYYDVIFPLPAGGLDSAPHRRFFPSSAPHYSAGKFEWTIKLERAHPDNPSYGTSP
jgi:hypothetical protein